MLVGLFAGRCARATRKNLRPSLHSLQPLPSPRTHEEEEWTQTVAKAHPRGDWARSPRVAHGRVLRPSRLRSEQAVGALSPPLFERMGNESIPTPSALKWLKSSLERLSEKGRKSLWCSLMDHRNRTFRPILASPHRLNPRFEGCSYPFSDSLRSRVLGSWPRIHRPLLAWVCQLI
jgi:hypothetical protein